MSASNRIMVIRHGEKPPRSASAPYGVLPNGTRDAGSLTPRGWQRAGALAAFFADTTKPLAVPDRIYAAHPKADGGSSRPLQTVGPLAARLGLTIDARFHRSDIVGLVDRVLRQRGDVLVCWDHEHIPEIARAILGERSAVPKWSGKRFDMVWLFTRREKSYKLDVLPQRLLSGDRDRL